MASVAGTGGARPLQAAAITARRIADAVAGQKTAGDRTQPHEKPGGAARIL